MPLALSDKEINDLIAKANTFLKSSRVSAKIERVSNRLYLRATLPPKPGHHRARPFQQRIALFLPCTKRGIRLAQSRAITLGNELIDNRFEWENWWKPRKSISVSTAGYWIDKFEKNYRSKNTITDRSWRDGWLQHLNKVDKNSELTPELLINAVLKKKPNTAQRKNICTRLQTFADFAGVNVDLSEYRGKYGRALVKPRELPSDEMISEWATSGKIADPSWRRVYGLIAVFGLRPHEAFLGHLRSDGKYQVTEGKTGPRLVSPFYPEWLDQWDLWPDILPDFNMEKAKRDTQFSNYIHSHLRRKYKVPFQPYDLRHAYAVRVHNVFGLSEAVGARLMGHSVDVHLSTYQRWLGDEAANKAIERVLAKDDRPRAPC